MMKNFFKWIVVLVFLCGAFGFYKITSDKKLEEEYARRTLSGEISNLEFQRGNLQAELDSISVEDLSYLDGDAVMVFVFRNITSDNFKEYYLPEMRRRNWKGVFCINEDIGYTKMNEQYETAMELMDEGWDWCYVDKEVSDDPSDPRSLMLSDNEYLNMLFDEYGVSDPFYAVFAEDENMTTDAQVLMVPVADPDYLADSTINENIWKVSRLNLNDKSITTQLTNALAKSNTLAIVIGDSIGERFPVILDSLENLAQNHHYYRVLPLREALAYRRNIVAERESETQRIQEENSQAVMELETQIENLNEEIKHLMNQM